MCMPLCKLLTANFYNLDRQNVIYTYIFKEILTAPPARFFFGSGTGPVAPMGLFNAAEVDEGLDTAPVALDVDAPSAPGD